MSGRWLFALLGAASIAAGGLGCSSSPRSVEQRALGRVWLDYTAMPAQRALAIAGDIRRNRYVAAASSGHETSDAAQKDALAQCALKRQRARMQDPCRLYAIGDELVRQGD